MLKFIIISVQGYIIAIKQKKLMKGLVKKNVCALTVIFCANHENNNTHLSRSLLPLRWCVAITRLLVNKFCSFLPIVYFVLGFSPHSTSSFHYFTHYFIPNFAWSPFPSLFDSSCLTNFCHL